MKSVGSGRESYARAHIPGAGFADIPSALSDPASPFAFTLPAAEDFAAAIGRLGIGLFALWLTGRDDARLYDGSLTEWSAHPDLPLDTG
jgi:thiosulfate/3-mercaptopyruvate sulfurtransferase